MVCIEFLELFQPCLKKFGSSLYLPTKVHSLKIKCIIGQAAGYIAIYVFLCKEIMQAF